MAKTALFSLLLSLLFAGCGKADDPQSSHCTPRDIPESIYAFSSTAFSDTPTPSAPVVGIWQLDSLEITFNSDSSWNIALILEDGPRVNASGIWALTIKNGIHYLKLTYTHDTFYGQTGVDEEGSPVYGWFYNFPYASLSLPNRVIIVEYFVDETYFVLNSYRKNDGTDLFTGSWIHHNYQDYPGYSAANYNRSGTLSFNALYEEERQNCNTLSYAQTASPYFTTDMDTGDGFFTGLNPDVANDAVSFAAEYSLGDEALSWFNAENTLIMPDNDGFKIIVMRTLASGTFLLTYPFTKK